jgi:hypothetical protein
MKTFKHSGDLGDIIYSLPTIKQLGGGILYLDTTGGEDEPICRVQCPDGKTKFNDATYNFIKPLIEAQSYIKAVKKYNGNKVDYNLNNFRYKFADPNRRSQARNLLDLHLDAFNLPEWDHNSPWLETNNIKKLDKKTIVSRTPRYQCSHTWFESQRFNFRDKSIFVGLEKEHELFQWTFNIKVPFFKVKDALELAEILKGANHLVSNQTSTLAIGIGLGTVSIVQEVYTKLPNVVFENKKNMIYV